MLDSLEKKAKVLRSAMQASLDASGRFFTSTADDPSQAATGMNA
jgi:hypothetical protein